jgi:hypothetical protein
MLHDGKGFLIESRGVATINKPEDILIQDIAAPDRTIDILTPTTSLPFAYAEESQNFQKLARSNGWRYHTIDARGSSPIELNAQGIAAGVVHISTHSIKAVGESGVSTVHLAFDNDSGIGMIDHTLIPITRIADFPLQGNYLLNLSSCGNWDASEVIIDPRSPLSPAYMRDMVIHAGGQNLVFGLWGLEEMAAFYANYGMYHSLFAGNGIIESYQSGMKYAIKELRSAGLDDIAISSRIGGLTLGVTGHLHQGDYESATIVQNARNMSIEELYYSSSKINSATSRNDVIESLKRYEYFTIGSTWRDVLQVMGEPTRKDPYRWYYNDSFIEFSRQGPGLTVATFVQGKTPLKAILLGGEPESSVIAEPTILRNL